MASSHLPYNHGIFRTEPIARWKDIHKIENLSDFLPPFTLPIFATVLAIFYKSFFGKLISFPETNHEINFMNKPYVFNYQAPVNPWWESSAAEIAEGSGDLDNLLKQTHEDLHSLGETVLRLDGELRTAKIDKVVAEKKIEVISKLIQDVSVLRRNEPLAAIQNASHSADTIETPKRQRQPKHRKTGKLLSIVVILVLACVSLFVFAAVFATHSGSEPWSSAGIKHFATWLQPFVNKFLH